MLYYFWKELKEFPSKSQETSQEKSRQFPNQAKKLQEESPINPRKKSNQFPIQSQFLRFFTSVFSFGKITNFACS